MKNTLRIFTIMMTLLGTHLFANRAVQNFNSDWKFIKGDQTDAAAQMDFDDSAWQAVTLPHDWAIAGPFNPEEHGFAGKLPWKGVGWYRKTFDLDKADSGKQVYLDFDGVMAFPKVYVNGQLAGEWDYGYMSFRVDATPYVKFGEKNNIAVQADTRNHGTRWYPGAGIYRKVTMTICEPVHISHWSTCITTPIIDEKTATVQIRSTIESHLKTESNVDTAITLLDPKGKVAAVLKTEGLVIEAGKANSLDQLLTIKNPRLWDVDSPNLYAAKIVVTCDGKVVDTENTTFGIRTFEFTGNDGFHLNGRRVQLYGVCLHHDQGPLGAAFYPRAMERQLEIMRDMGCNAIRTSHNPPAPELLELCDEMGFVVWDECFDKWDDKADRVNGQPPLEDHGAKQLHNFVMRDRNHPSIVVWSIANEIGAKSRRNEDGLTADRVKFMRDCVLKYDTTRPVGAAFCHPEIGSSDIPASLDLTGWNYMRRYNLMKERYPDKPIIYSESASALSTRGFYELPLPTKKTEYSKQMQVNSYDQTAADWSDIPDKEFDLMQKDKFVAGEFVWTGFDYLGEPTPFDKEARSSYFGIVDLCGIPKDRFYLYRSYWRPMTTTVHILPHWNWPDRIGKEVPVYVYSNGDEVELFLNGKSLGRKTKTQAVEKPINIALGKPAKASSEQADKGNLAAMVVDSKSDTRWCAANSNADAWWQVDLGQVQPVSFMSLVLEKELQYYTFEIQVSNDESNWNTIAEKKDNRGYSNQTEFALNTQARYVRIQFKTLSEGTWACIRDVEIYSNLSESPYYACMNNYRFRWMDVVYQPGQLKAVAYKGGKQIGHATMQTAGQPAAIRLTPDRKKLSPIQGDLSYILVEAVDAKGNLCPLADNRIHFTVQGSAAIAGIDNGNPMSFESFQTDNYKLFYGKAMLVIRTEGKTGDIQITAKAEGLKDSKANLRCGDNLLEGILGIFGIK
jgi:beta-galactosidase/beta-glucuronidase